MKQLVTGFGVGMALIVGLVNAAIAMDEYPLIIQNHQFSPASITIPANTKVKLIVKNLDPMPEEFDSQQLHREKVIQGNGQGVVFIGPLDPGEYAFIGEFHESTAKGQIIVK